MAPLDLSGLQTEGRNIRSTNIDELSSLAICELINEEDATVAEAVKRELTAISAAVHALAPQVRDGGRVIYVGAGTSGRLGVLDASEIPPTFSAPYGQFVALMAGGDAAIRRAQEGAEDSRTAAESDLEPLGLDPRLDALIGIAASGQTPYVLGCLAYAKRIGCMTIGIACCSPSAMAESGLVDYMIAPVTGPEVITGSTRMKAGTATKLVLNTISTAVMIKVGKTFGNMMVDLKPSNNKLKQRSRNIVRLLGKALAPDSDDAIDHLIQQCGGSVKLAVGVMHLGTSVEEARQRLDAAGGKLSLAIERARGARRSHQAESADPSGLILCVDGGGSKCAAVVSDSEGRMGHGRGGPCNVTSTDFATAMTNISRAISMALEAYSQQASVEIPRDRMPRFSAVWIGLAGFERPHLQSRLKATLSEMLHLPIGRQLRLSADIDLLSAPLVLHGIHESAIVLVAGTGSIAVRYTCRDGAAVRTGRSGGWGGVLGDDGSGFDLGRRAIRHTLLALDNQQTPDLSPLHRAVLKHCSIDVHDASSSALLNALLSPAVADAPGRHDSATNSYKNIARLARTVLDLAVSDQEASAIVQTGVAGLVRTVLPLANDRSFCAAKACLILGGGLMQSPLYRQAVVAKLKESGMEFGSVHTVADPALGAAEMLRKQVHADSARRVRAKL